MTIVCGALTFAGDVEADGLARRIAGAGGGPAGAAGEVLLGEDRQIAFRLVATGDVPPRVVRATTADGRRVTAVGWMLDLPQDADPARDALARDPERALAGCDGVWLAMIHDPATGSLRIRNDVLGVAWLYVAQLSGGFAFSSDFGALVAGIPGPLTTDEDTCLTMLALTYSPDERTSFKEISMLPCGRWVEFSGRGAAAQPAAPLKYGDSLAGAPPARKHEVLDGLLQESIHAWSKAGSGDWVVALSGGFDSRYGLALLDREGVRPRCLTFGNPGSYDVTGARRVARRLGLEHGVYRVKQGSWPAWRRSVQRLGVIGGFQYVTGWADDWLGSLRARGSRVILGFLGDALSGKHLVERDAADWIGNWARWSLDDGRDVNWVESDLLAPAVRRRMRELMTERFEALCRPQTFAFPHQKALHLDLFGRQRRAAASQANLIADHLAPVPFFYTRALIEFWSSLGYEDLRGQALYRSFALERYPRIFEPERRPGVPARLWGAARNLVVGALPQTKNLLAPGEIDTRAQLALHKAGVRALVESAAPAIAGWLDVSSLLRQIDRFPAAGGINALQLQRLANLLMLLELGGDRRAGATAAGGAQAANLP